MQQYFLLDQYPNPNSFKEVWKLCSPKAYAIFDATPLSDYKKKGPMLLTGGIEKLITEYKTNPEKWTGLLITSEATEEQLINHLKSLLFVTYPPESKGVITYYDSHTAHYLFNYTETENLNQWLGPIQTLTWYGGTWQQQANNQLQWHELTREDYERGQSIEAYKHLTEKQQQGLLIARQHKYAYDWSINHQATFDSTYKHLQEAIELNFDELQQLNNYLTLRALHPTKTLPTELSGNSAEERLLNLENYWNQYLQGDIYV